VKERRHWIRGNAAAINVRWAFVDVRKDGNFRHGSRGGTFRALILSSERVDQNARSRHFTGIEMAPFAKP
jgi:hypothetical protein